jgi:type I restriction enzyme R subunit
VLDKVSGLRGKRFAIIVDEAHSSQSGESSAALKKVLLKLGSDDIDEDGDPLTASALARGRHETLSDFTFTATPKSKTLQLFGTPHPVSGNLRPFHVYSMRQAIDEGFILHVLSNYVTYKTYWRLSNANADDREVDQRKAGAQLARFAVLSPSSLQQRAEIIMDHFHDRVRSKLQGRAKAMVVTSSRDHAVRLYRKLVSYGDMRGYDGCGVLVAFSGELEVEGNPEDKVTEAVINGFSEAELPKKFAYTRADDPHVGVNPKPEYRILVVADKYQTGFDQPLLTTMYVDKKLQNVAAVQTLSRLNRTHPLKPGGPSRPRLRQRCRGDPRGVQALLRDHHHRTHRPEPALQRAAGGHGLRTVDGVGNGVVRDRLPRRRVRRTDRGAVAARAR